MSGTIICVDTGRLEEFGFKMRERCDKSRFYIWNADGVYDGSIDICVDEFADKRTGTLRFHKLNKTAILPKLIQLANAGVIKNWEP